MSCNSCAKPFSIVRKEKGCPGCGFSYCSTCLSHAMFLKKLNAKAKVCLRCKNGLTNSMPSSVSPPAALQRLASLNERSTTDGASALSAKDLEIQQRLEKLKEDKLSKNVPTQQEIEARLKKIKDVPETTDDEIRERLNKLRGVPTVNICAQPPLPIPERKSEQEQADALLAQYAAQAAAEARYRQEFDERVSDMESRLGALRGAGPGSAAAAEPQDQDDVRDIIEKYSRAAILEDTPTTSPDMEELPFCEICNEDATLRCLGCRYLFCKRCYLEHKDDDDGCNRYEPYKPKKTI